MRSSSRSDWSDSGAGGDTSSNSGGSDSDPEGDDLTAEELAELHGNMIRVIEKFNNICSSRAKRKSKKPRGESKQPASGNADPKRKTGEKKRKSEEAAPPPRKPMLIKESLSAGVPGSSSRRTTLNGIGDETPPTGLFKPLGQDRGPGVFYVY